MARKRKTEATRLDEVDRTLYSTFCSAANSLSQLYTQAMNQQKISFQAGERHGLEKLYQWIVRKHEEGSRITVADIVAHIQSTHKFIPHNVEVKSALEKSEITINGLSNAPHNSHFNISRDKLNYPTFAETQNEMDYAGDDPLVTPRSPFQHQHQPMHSVNSGTQPPSGLFGQQPTVGLAPRSGGHSDQAKNSVFSNALSSPIRRSLQPFHLAQGGGFYANGGLPTGNAGSRNHDPNQNRDTNSPSSNDLSMDIHTDTDSPPHESY